MPTPSKTRGAKCPDQKSGVELIADERARQIAVEGWSFGHDDEHDECELARASACYALPPNIRNRWFNKELLWNLWPWEPKWWKPSSGDRVRELVKAGALIAAEIDRINRLTK